MSAVPSLKPKGGNLSLCDFALEYAKNGWPVFPCDLNKKPLTLHGFHDATRKPDQIKVWWLKNMGAAIGVATGPDAGFFVLDVDVPKPAKEKKTDGRITLGELESIFGTLPETLESQTGSGGRHLFFRYPTDGRTIRNNSESKLGPGLDIRGQGGYIIAPPSLHESGQYYLWKNPGVQIVEAPDWLLDKICEQNYLIFSAKNQNNSNNNINHAKNNNNNDNNLEIQNSDNIAEKLNLPCEHNYLEKNQKNNLEIQNSGYARAALDGEYTKVASASPGTRNGTLNASAFSLAQLVGGGVIARGDAENVLLTAALECGLSEQEARKTIQSGMEAGIKNPRAPEPRKKGRPKKESCVAAPSDESGLPGILWKPEALPDVLRQAEKAILNGNASGKLQFFQRGRDVVHVERILTGIQGNGITRRPGSLGIRSVNADCLRAHLADVAAWLKWNERKGAWVPCGVPVEVLKSYLAWAEPWKLPYLAGVIGAPTLRPDGSILDVPGYDPKTCLYFDPSGFDFPPVPAKPTKDDAAAALQSVAALLAEFPFCDGESRSVALSAILTALVRRVLPTSPLFAFTAPVMASGKTLLSHVVSLVATGNPCDAMSYTNEETESRKRIFSILKDGVSIVLFDNVEESLCGDTLCAVLTSELLTDRVLGKSESLRIPTTTLWMATGNNLVIKGDLATRCLLCHIDPTVERPEERQFRLNLYEYIPEHRGELVRDGLTILSAYQAAGCPDVGVKPFGRFEAWASMVRNPLVWLGEADPVKTLEAVRNADPDRELLRNVLTVWHELFGSVTLTTSELLFEADHNPVLREVLAPICQARTGEYNARTLGKWLAKYENRIVNGFRLLKHTNEDKKVATWTVIPQEGVVRAGV
jgi:hypothetical protein